MSVEEFYDTLDLLPTSTALIDQVGTIIYVNEAWRHFARDNGATDKNAYLGVNYLEVCESVTGPDAEDAQSFAQGIRQVLAGELDIYTYVYPCHSPRVKRWFIGKVAPFTDLGEGYVIIAHHKLSSRNVLRISA